MFVFANSVCAFLFAMFVCADFESATFCVIFYYVYAQWGGFFGVGARSEAQGNQGEQASQLQEGLERIEVSTCLIQGLFGHVTLTPVSHLSLALALPLFRPFTISLPPRRPN